LLQNDSFLHLFGVSNGRQNGCGELDGCSCSLFSVLVLWPRLVVTVQGVKERGNLSMLPELALKTALPYIENVEEFGHRVHVALLRVSSILASCL